MPAELRQRVANELRAVVEADPVITARIEATGQIVAIAVPTNLPPRSSSCMPSSPQRRES